MSVIGWAASIIGAIAGTTVFELVFYWLFAGKRIMPKHLDFAYQTWIRWWERVIFWYNKHWR